MAEKSRYPRFSSMENKVLVMSPIDRFSSTIRHLARLRNDGTLDEQTFSHLARHVAALFVEAEFLNCVNQVLGKSPLKIPF